MSRDPEQEYFADGVTSMARTTGYPCAIVARMMKNINNFGIIPPEKLGKDNVIFARFIKELRKRGVKINEEKCVR
jgi:saccharopine dehydrogenase-like NADP-dependent oxidoreductase